MAIFKRSRYLERKKKTRKRGSVRLSRSAPGGAPFPRQSHGKSWTIVDFTTDSDDENGFDYTQWCPVVRKLDFSDEELINY